MRVQAAVCRAIGTPLELEELELAEPGAGDILLRVVASGVGRLDREAVDGRLGLPLPFVPGSSAAGIVERVGQDVVDIVPGDSVFVDYASCGTCEACQADQPRACSAFLALNLAGHRPGGAPPFRGLEGEVNGFVFGQSSFATHVVCGADSVVKLPSDVPLEIVAGLGGEVLLGAAAVIESFRLRPGDTLAIVGAGAAGLAACLIAKDRGASSIVVAEPDPTLRDLASHCGATISVHGEADLGTAVCSLAADGAAFALETTGRAEALRACEEALCSTGLIGITRPFWQTNHEAPGSRRPHVVDRAVLARVLVPDLLDLYADGRFPVDRLISFFPFPKVNDALDALAANSSVKPVLRFALGAFGDLDRAKIKEAGKENEEPETVQPEVERPVAAIIKS